MSAATKESSGGVVLAVAGPSGRAPGRARRVVVEARARVWAAAGSLLVAVALVGVLVIALDLVDGVELLYRVLGRLVSRDVVRAWLWTGLGAAALRLELEVRHLVHTLRQDWQVRRCVGCRSAAAAVANATERWDSCAATHRATRRTVRQAAARIPGPRSNPAPRSTPGRTPGRRSGGAW